MFAEFEKVMSHSLENLNFLEALESNVTGKKSGSGIHYTASFLKRLYGFRLDDPCFLALIYFWKLSEPNERPLITLLFAVLNDDILAESKDVIHSVEPGQKVNVDLIEAMIIQFQPNSYSANTLRSMAQNIASSWKQAGYIQGKIKNVRSEPTITFRVACFAFLLAYLRGDRGDYIWNSLPVKALGLPEGKLRELALECARKDLMQYQYAGNVTAISFTNLLSKIGIHGNTH